jgi:hypothetical protein
VSVIVSKVDYKDFKQGDAIRFLMNAYASDPMGGGKALDDVVLKNLVTEFLMHLVLFVMLIMW